MIYVYGGIGADGRTLPNGMPEVLSIRTDPPSWFQLPFSLAYGDYDFAHVVLPSS